MADLNFLVLGDLILDEYIQGDINETFERVPVVVHRSKQHALGGAGNFMRNLAAFPGVRIHYISPIGIAAYHLNELLGEVPGLHYYGPYCPDYSPCVKTRVISSSRLISRTDVNNVVNLTDEEQQKICDLWREVTQDTLFSAAIISDYGLGAATPTVCQSAIMQCVDKGIPIYVDPWGTDWSKYRGATCIKPNDEEFYRWVTARHFGKRLAPGDVARVSGRTAKEACQGPARLAEYILHTRGPSGVNCYTNTEHLQFPTACKKPLDPTGAGDTFLAALVYFLALGFNLVRTIGQAQRLAGQVILRPGTAALTPEDAEKALQAMNDVVHGKAKKELRTQVQAV